MTTTTTAVIIEEESTNISFNSNGRSTSEDSNTQQNLAGDVSAGQTNTTIPIGIDSDMATDHDVEKIVRIWLKYYEPLGWTGSLAEVERTTVERAASANSLPYQTVTVEGVDFDLKSHWLNCESSQDCAEMNKLMKSWSIQLVVEKTHYFDYIISAGLSGGTPESWEGLSKPTVLVAGMEFVNRHDSSTGPTIKNLKAIMVKSLEHIWEDICHVLVLDYGAPILH